MYPSQQRTAVKREAVVLLVVLVMLTLFALIGLAFVVYSQSEATSSRIWREAQNLLDDRPDEPTDVLLNYSLAQVIFDTEDVYSALRGHSLSRNMYGWNKDMPGSNIVPFNGVGRWRFQWPVGGMTPVPAVLQGQADDFLINHQYFSTDGFVRDPERYGYRASLAAALGAYTGGWNPPYTYPDGNHLFLAAVTASGSVLVPSFHRPWMGFGSLDPSNVNWTSTTDASLKYKILRPRPADNNTTVQFPRPASAGGDVLNLKGSSGYNNAGADSIWIDLGYPVKTGPDGITRYKPLFAFLIIDLDNRVNVNVHGNIRGRDATGKVLHSSNLGLGKSEVNLGQVITGVHAANTRPEWTFLFDPTLSTTPPTGVNGRYGADKQPAAAGSLAPAIAALRSYAPLDVDGCNETGTPAPAYGATGLPELPGTGSAVAYQCFPKFPAGYSNGSAAELTNHPLNFDLFNPQGGDRVFDASHMGRMLSDGLNSLAEAANTDLGLLCPVSFGSWKTCNLVTTTSFDVDRPGSYPMVWDPSPTTSPAYKYQLVVGNPAPTGPAIPFAADPSYNPTGMTAAPVTAGTVPSGTPTEFATDWRSLTSALGRVDLNRPLTAYPTPASWNAAINWGTQGTQYKNALTERRRLASDIYQVLRRVTGAADPATLAATSTEFQANRWLAQLAVNIVDYVDADDYITSWNWGTDSGGTGQWVFGTELSRLVLNEVYVEYVNDPTDTAVGMMMKATKPYKVCFWIELHNPFFTEAGLSDNGAARLLMPNGGSAYAVHQIVVGKAADATYLQNVDNVKGDWDPSKTPFLVVTDYTPDMNFTPTAADANIVQPGGGLYKGAVGDNQGFYLIGPGDKDLTFPGGSVTATLKVKDQTLPDPMDTAMTKTVRSSLVYEEPATGAPTAAPTLINHSILLRRLACPHLPPKNDPAADDYNPYITVDYLETVPPNDGVKSDNVGVHAATAVDLRSSSGRKQPYAAHKYLVKPQVPDPANMMQPQHSLFQHNVDSGTPGPNVGTAPAAYPAFDWLVHLDRPLISAMELLHVSGNKPHELTQKFIVKTADDGMAALTSEKFQHTAPWFQENTRIYRGLEFFQVRDRLTGMTAGGRRAGMININTIWDIETFRALCDVQTSNRFTAAQVDAMYGQMVALRTPAGTPGGTDRPFLGMAARQAPADLIRSDRATGIDDTFLRANGANRLFEIPGQAHPYQRFELMTKIHNHVTTRSNVFGVWVSVGFFQVTDETTTPVKLGPEIGKSLGKEIRHRMFSIVDRTNLALAQSVTTLNQAVAGTPIAPVQATLRVGALSGTTTPTTGATAIPWAITAGSTLVIDPGTATEETIRVTAVDGTAVPPTLTATFIRSHGVGAKVTIPGNPGPQPAFDLRQPFYSSVVPYAAILE